jgi:3-dehydroquinate synthase
VKIVEVTTAPAYSVLIGSGLLRQAGERIAAVHKPCTAALVTDTLVDSLYAASVIESLTDAGFRVIKFVFPHGEQSKTLEIYAQLLSFLSDNGVTRSDLIVALGGGVVGDLAGFVAATYLRGMEFVQIATTLLAQIDSSVGGKTAVDLPQGKNLVGAFWQPSLVLCDPDCLNTLAPHVWADGLAEAIKYGMIADADLLYQLCCDGLKKDPDSIIARCIQLKALAVEADERDFGERQKLNFGHTAGHSVEKHSNFTITHGHGVAIGMSVVTRACVRRGLVPPETWTTLEQVLIKHNLPTQSPVSAEILAEGAFSDKKRRGSSITLVLPVKVGQCTLTSFQLEELKDFFQDGL